MKTSQEYGEWVYISPVYNLEILDDIKGEIKIGRVHFVNIRKLPLIRKRLRLPAVLSKLGKNTANFFSESKTYTLLTFKGIPDEMVDNCRKIVEDAISILSFSQLGYCSRRNNSQFGLTKDRQVLRTYILNADIFKGTLNASVVSKVLPFRLDKNWYDFHKSFFFFDLLKLVSSQSKTQKKWKDTIIRASIMVGKSMQSRDLEYCFLWNMIVIEMLLTEQGDKYSESLSERAEAFLGWVGYWKEKNFKEKINILYKKRCVFVHDGNSINITPNDVQFTDDLVFNLLWNIVSHIKLFPSKRSIINFSEKVKAEKVLKLESSVQPKTLRFLNREYDADNIKKI